MTLSATRDSAWDAYQRSKGHPASVRRPLREAYDAAEVRCVRAERISGNVGTVALDALRRRVRP